MFSSKSSRRENNLMGWIFAGVLIGEAVLAFVLAMLHAG